MGILEDIQKFLVSQNLTLGDVVMMRVYMGGDQPNKPACTAVQAVLVSGARGALVEIDFVVVRPKSPSGRRAGG